MIGRFSDVGISHESFCLKGRRLGFGDTLGNVCILRLHSSDKFLPQLTPAYIYRFAHRAWDTLPSVKCEYCERRFAVPASVLDAISALTRRAGLIQEDSPSMKLPSETWSDPGLVFECPCCLNQVRFNPFIADSRDWAMTAEVKGVPRAVENTRRHSKFWR